MKKLTNAFVQTVSLLLIILWVYAPVSKLINFSHFRGEMYNQVFGPSVSFLLTYFLPPGELIIAGLLLFETTKNAGLFSSLVLMFLFTGYVGLVNFHFFSEVPCSCGGILEHMGWSTHFYFNLIFLCLTTITIFIIQRKEQPGKK